MLKNFISLHFHSITLFHNVFGFSFDANRNRVPYLTYHSFWHFNQHITKLMWILDCLHFFSTSVFYVIYYFGGKFSYLFNTLFY